MTKRSIVDRFETELIPAIELSLAKLGFARTAAGPLREKATEVWFSRREERALSELVCISVIVRPKLRAFVDLYVSPLEPVELRGRSLRGEIFGQNLFQFQFYARGARLEEILPMEIPLADPTSWQEVLRRLENELSMLEGTFWKSIAEAAQLHRPDWFKPRMTLH